MAIALFGLILASILMTLVVTDVQEGLLPDWLNALLAMCGLAQSLWFGTPDVKDALLGAAVGGTLMLAVAIGYMKLRAIPGLGLGDVKLVAAGMVWLEPRWLGPLLLIATLSALAIMLARAAWKMRLDPREAFPFGPFLAIAIFCCWGLSTIGY